MKLDVQQVDMAAAAIWRAQQDAAGRVQALRDHVARLEQADPPPDSLPGARGDLAVAEDRAKRGAAIVALFQQARDGNAQVLVVPRGESVRDVG